MNKVYRLVWNKATQTWNAVSEYAKSQGKSTNAVIMPSLKGAYGVMRTLVRFAYTVLVSALLLLSGRAAIAATGTTTGSGQAVPSTADYNTCYYDVTSQSVVCGTADTKTANTSDTKTAKAVVIGKDTTNTGESNIAIGTSSATGSTTFTETVTAVTKNGTTTTNTEVTFNPTGTPSTTTNTTTTTDSSGTNITTVVTATTKEAQPVAAIAIGNEAKAYDNQSIAIGQKATANADWDISIGRNAGSGITSIAPEGRNIAIGDGALKEAVLPNNNIAMGTDASSKQKGNFNVVIGTYANSPTALGSTKLDNGNAITATFVEANDTVAIGERALAIQSNAVSIGNRSKSTGAAAVAIGTGSEASGNYAIAQGYSAVASGVSSVAIGAAQNLGVNQTRATGNFSVALGSIATKASGDSSVAIGKTATAPTDNSIAIGKDAKVEAEGLISNGQKKSIGAIAIGNASTSQGKASVAIGNEVSSQTHGVVIGVKSTASEVGAIAIGQNNTATTANSAALGSNTHATGNNSFAAGNASDAVGQSSIAIGDGAKANTDTTVTGNGWGTAVGNGATAEWAASAYGYQAKATGGASVAVGNAAAKAQNSIAVGNEAKANDIGSIAIGKSATATGQNSVVVGTTNESSANNTVVVGTSSKATKENAIAVGNKAMAYNTGNIVLGTNSGQITDTANVANVGADSILIGAEAGKDAYSNAKQISMGFKAGQNVSGAENIAIGNGAGSGASDTNRLTITKTIAIGSDAIASKNNAIALGNNAKSKAEATIAIGQNAGLTSDAATSNTNTRAIMMGVNAAKGAQNVNDSILMGQAAGENLGVKTATGSHNIGLGARALQNASGSTNVALATEAGTGAEGNNNFFGQVGAGSYVKGDNNIAIGRNAQKGTNADIITASDTIVLGTESKADKDKAIAIGKGAQASAENAISIGTGNVVSGKNSGALGDPSYVSGAGTYTIGNDNGAAVKPVSANNAGVFGNNNALSGHGSRIVGNSNAVSGENTFVMGNNVTATAQNNVILGHNSSESSATTTNGQFNQVDDAKVGTVTYNGFAGTASGVVSVGASGAERQIINVAPGKVSADSTDAINGSQLYAVIDKVQSGQTTPLTVNAGKVDTPATANAGKLATAGDIANAINNTGFTLTTAATANGEVTGTSNELIKAGDTVTVEADKNIKVTQANGKVTIATKDDVNFNSVIANGTKIDNTGFSFVDATGAKVVNTPSITRNGIDLGGQKITNVQAGSATTDAVNVGQLQNAINNVGNTTRTAVQTNSPFAYVNAAGEILLREIDPTGTVVFKKSDGSTYLGTDISISALHATDPQTATPVSVGNVAAGKKDIDAVNVSQLKGALNVIGGGADVNTDGTIKAPAITIKKTDGSNEVKGTVVDAITVLNQEVIKPLEFSDDSGTKIERKLGSELKVKGGATGDLSDNNIGVKADTTTGTLNVKLAKDLKKLSSIELEDAAGNSVRQTGLGIAIMPASGDLNKVVELNLNGLNNGNNKITNVKAGTDDTDGVNISQLKGATDALGLTIDQNTGAVSAPSFVVTGANGTTYPAANTVQGALNNIGTEIQKPLTFAGDNITGYTSPVSRKLGEELTITGGIDDPNIALSEGGNIAVVADTNANSLRLKLAKDLLDMNSITAIDPATGGAAIFNGTGITITPDATGNNKVSLTDKGLNNGGNKITNVKAGTQGTDAVNLNQLNTVKNTVEGKLGGFTVGADKNATAAGIDVNKDNARFDIVGADNGKVTTTIDGNKISVDLTADAKASLDKADTAVQGIKVKANGDDVTTLDKDNNTLEITQGDNITVANDNGKVKVSLNSDVAGLDSLTSKVVTAGTGDSQVILNDNGVNVGGNTYISKDGLNANNKKVINVIDGDISATSKDAVNGSQLYATNQNVAANATNITNLQNQTFKLQANGDTATAVKASDTVQFLNGENIAITRNGNDITVATKKDLVVDSVKAGDTLVNNAGVVIKALAGGTTSDVKLTAAGLDNGKNKITNVAAGTDDTDAVNVSQLKAVETKAGVKTKVTAGDGVDVTNTGTADAPNYTVAINQATKDDIAKGVAAKDVVDNKGLTFAGDSGTTGVKKLGDSISVKGDNNITTKADANGVLVTLNKDLNVNSVIANGTKIDDNGLSFVDASGNAVANSPVISKTGINAGNQKITNVAAGVADTDAVNVGQLKAAKSITTAGKNITVKTVQNNDGSTSYEVATKDEVTFNKTTVGNVITDAATGKIIGLTKGDVNAASTDAINGSQLYAQGTGVQNIIGGNTVYNPADGTYTNTDIGGTGKANIDAAIKAVKTEVVAGDNIAVASTVDADGKTTYTVATKKDLVVDSVKAGNNVTLNNTGLTAGNVTVTADGINAGNTAITNVKSGLNGKTLEQIKADPNAAERSNAATIGDLTTVQNNVTNINNSYNTVVNKVIGGTTPDGKVTDANGEIFKDSKGNAVDASDALKTYNVSGNNAKTDNTLITAIKNMNEGGIKFFHVNDGTGEQNTTGTDAHAEDSAASGSYAAAVGYQAKATAENAIAIGKGAQAGAKNTISIGTGNIVTGENSGAIGDPSIIDAANSYSVGNNNVVNTENTFVLGNTVTQTVANSVFLGNNAASTGVHTTASGGNYTYAGVNDAGVSGVNDVVGVVSVGKEGETRQIQNVAAGVVSANSTDAINGSQLHATMEGLAGTTINMGNQLNNRINEVKDDADAGVSSAMAMAALPQAYLPGKSMVTGGMATYNGQGAVAVGLSKLSDNGRWVLKISGSADTKGNAGGAVGAGFHF